MKKKFLSIFVILITAITVFTMFQGFKEKDANIDSNLFKEKSPKVNSLNTEEKESKIDISKNNEDENKNINHEKENDIHNEEDTNDVLKEKKVEKEEDYNQDKNYETAEVFKVNKDEIKDKITLNEKSKLLLIAGKLSMLDYAKIVETMKSSDEMNSASEIFQILKTRLNDEDYAKVKKILEPYMFVENIENNISQNKN
ncbi:hypothetical protein SAMN05444401_0685 [Clostridium amylolyticum]|uniref:DUF4476 domain-containing protein n=1 Tax=Clostridium amylolyticum TaxID=1121298 RepID=A0A1M6BA97_9CLOT|nr:hypothetical protein [Clostridium amylolyticum]SHI45670.1 hypothetical protein SAMN05444401_0685 [Clostridium amylolyticum]